MTRVVKIGGRAQNDPRLMPALVALARTGDPLCVVHGGGDEVSALQRKVGLEPRFSGGRRVTSEHDLEIVRNVLSGSINKRIAAQLVTLGVRAVGISGEDGGLFSARVAPGAPLGRVGESVDVDAAVVAHLLAGGFVPVVSPLASDADAADGAGLNVNGDDAAAALAAALGAGELVFVADVPGVLAKGAVVPELDAETAAALISDGTASAGMAAKLEAAVAALHGGCALVRIAGVEGIGDANAGTRVVLAPSPAGESA